MEAVAQARLERQGFEAFFPPMWEARWRARRTEAVRGFMFSCYSFARFDPQFDRWRSINGTIGVSRLVMARERPQSVPHGVVEAMAAATAEDGITVLDHGLKEGDPVRLVSRPFSGELGVLEGLDTRGLVALLLPVMNGSVRPRIFREMLGPVG